MDHDDDHALAGLPELDMFPDDESRRRAVATVQAGAMRTPSIWLAAALHGALVWFAWKFARRMLAAMFPQIRPWSSLIAGAIVLALYFLLLFRTLRPNPAVDLRRELLRCGVPVCLRCGFDLRTCAEEDRHHCPECGDPTELPDPPADDEPPPVYPFAPS